jgi:hypothetical protein
MNPLIKDTVDKIANNFKLTQRERIIIAYYVGEALTSALEFAKENPNYNLKGGDSIDENTITYKKQKAYQNMFKNNNI